LRAGRRRQRAFLAAPVRWLVAGRRFGLPAGILAGLVALFRVAFCVLPCFLPCLLLRRRPVIDLERAARGLADDSGRHRRRAAALADQAFLVGFRQPR
jgi:hypothetical protein